MISRGEIWWGDLGLPGGSAPAFRRPILVISGDRYNASRLETVVVAALTTNQRYAAFPGNVAIPAETSGLDESSVVNVTQLATVDRRTLERRVGALPTWLMCHVDDGLRRALGL